jgi:hypothetical protein
MTRVEKFVDMLAQMAVHFNVTQVVTCVLTWANDTHVGFLLLMQNGEYWYVTDMPLQQQVGQYTLFKFPPPIPAFSQLEPMPMASLAVEFKPRDINAYIMEMGGSETLFMSEQTTRDN